MLVFATRGQYAAHLRPIWDALPPDMPDDIALVASHRDVVKVRMKGYTRIVLAQHGAGQSYGGDPRTARIAAYPGGDDNADVGLFLCPNEHSAQRWRDAYPRAAVRVVGSPRLATLPSRDGGDGSDGPVVAVSFHWDGLRIPEMHSAFDRYRSAVLDLAKSYKVIGHGHPNRPSMFGYWERHGIEAVRDFDDVCRRADLYVCDNSSTIFEFAATGRPVLVLDLPEYRQGVRHGLRFWDAADVGVRISDPADLADGVVEALEDEGFRRAVRQWATGIVYAYRHDAARRAADAIVEWSGVAVAA